MKYLYYHLSIVLVGILLWGLLFVTVAHSFRNPEKLAAEHPIVKEAYETVQQYLPEIHKAESTINQNENLIDKILNYDITGSN